MRIVCPACDATYDVPDAMLAGGARKVRCAKCGSEWVPAAPPPPRGLEFEPEPAFDSIPPPPPEPLAAPPLPDADPLGRHEPRLRPLRPRPEPRLAEPPLPAPDSPPRHTAAEAVVAWVLSLVLLAAVGVAAVAWRTQVMAAWPPSVRLYSAVGLR